MQVELEFAVGKPDHEYLYSKSEEMLFAPNLGSEIKVGYLVAEVESLDPGPTANKVYARLKPQVSLPEDKLVELLERHGYTTGP